MKKKFDIKAFLKSFQTKKIEPVSLPVVAQKPTPWEDGANVVLIYFTQQIGDVKPGVHMVVRQAFAGAEPQYAVYGRTEMWSESDFKQCIEVGIVRVIRSFDNLKKAKVLMVELSEPGEPTETTEE